MAAETAVEPIAEGLAALRDAPAGGWAARARASVERFTYAAQAQAFTTLYDPPPPLIPRRPPGRRLQTLDFH